MKYISMIMISRHSVCVPVFFIAALSKVKLSLSVTTLSRFTGMMDVIPAKIMTKRDEERHGFQHMLETLRLGSRVGQDLNKFQKLKVNCLSGSDYLRPEQTGCKNKKKRNW